MSRPLSIGGTLTSILLGSALAAGWVWHVAGEGRGVFSAGSAMAEAAGDLGDWSFDSEVFLPRLDPVVVSAHPQGLQGVACWRLEYNHEKMRHERVYGETAYRCIGERRAHWDLTPVEHYPPSVDWTTDPPELDSEPWSLPGESAGARVRRLAAKAALTGESGAEWKMLSDALIISDMQVLASMKSNAETTRVVVDCAVAKDPGGIYLSAYRLLRDTPGARLVKLVIPDVRTKVLAMDLVKPWAYQRTPPEWTRAREAAIRDPVVLVVRNGRWIAYHHWFTSLAKRWGEVSISTGSTCTLEISEIRPRSTPDGGDLRAVVASALADRANTVDVGATP